MDLPQLPSDWVSTLNELAYSRSLSDEGLQQLQQAAQDLRNWHAFESGYTLDEAELQELDNLRYLIDELEQAVHAEHTRPDLDFLAPRMVQVVRLMESIQQGREKARYSPHQVLNDMCLAGASLTVGSAEERAIADRIPRVRGWREFLWEDYSARTDLPQAAKDDLETGFRHLDASLRELAQAREPEQIKASLAHMLEASELLQVLVDWRQRTHEALAQRYRRWSALPVVGARLEHVVSGHAELHAEHLRPLIVELGFWWGQNRDLLALPAEVANDWISEVDEHLEQLLNLEGPLDPVEIGNWLDHLSAGFSRARQALQPVDHLRGGQAGHYFELIQGLLRNTVPVVAVPALFDTSPPPEAWKPVVDHILEFTKNGHREQLYQARELLLALVPHPGSIEVQDHWVCPFCQQRNALGATTCGHCGGGASVALEVPSWDA